MAKKKVNESLSEYAGTADKDHEVQMARADLYNLAHQSIELHKILSTTSEEQGLEGWQQAKITKAADYINSVFTNLQYDQTMTSAPMPPPPVVVNAGVRSAMSETQIADYKALLEKAKSKAQQKFMGMVHAAQQGEKPASKAVADVAKDMPKKAAKDYAATKHKGLPAHVDEEVGQVDERNAENKLKKDVHAAKLGHAADVGRHNYASKELAPLTKRSTNRDSLKTAVAKMKRAGRAELKHGRDAGYIKTLNDFGKDIPRK